MYFPGLPWLSRRGSSFIWGVWHDARYIADQISIQRGYAAYPTTALGVVGQYAVDGAAAAGNLLATPDVPRRLVEGWHAVGGQVETRLLAAFARRSRRAARPGRSTRPACRSSTAPAGGSPTCASTGQTTPWPTSPHCSTSGFPSATPTSREP
ncbi:MAG TPA: hypothetical protein VFQ68_39150 [Streptosporangiaceae bacterium]|nr:hypothetical protein [Streptosporangiaceae bacterium]